MFRVHRFLSRYQRQVKWSSGHAWKAIMFFVWWVVSKYPVLEEIPAEFGVLNRKVDEWGFQMAMDQAGGQMIATRCPLSVPHGLFSGTGWMASPVDWLFVTDNDMRDETRQTCCKLNMSINSYWQSQEGQKSCRGSEEQTWTITAA